MGHKQEQVQLCHHPSMSQHTGSRLQAAAAEQPIYMTYILLCQERT